MFLSLPQFSLLTFCGRQPKKAGAQIEDGQRFGLNNLRHGLRNWLVNNAKVEPKIVQGILRYAKIRTALDLYTQEDIDETLAAQGEYLSQIPKKERLLARGQDFF